MNVQHHSYSNDVDLDSTAELPVLSCRGPGSRAAPEERLTSTDTWIIPPPTLRVARRGCGHQGSALLTGVAASE